MESYPLKLVVFPNDPIRVYFEKGEIKERYFNPDDLFKEIHLFTFTDREIDHSQVQILAGKARLEIYPLGKISFTNLIQFPLWRKKILLKILNIMPQVIRAYNPLLEGYLAVSIGRKLGIATVVSLHGNYDLDIRYHLRRRREYLRWVKYLLTSKTSEPYTLSHADKVICAYQFPFEYARRFGAREENIEVIYNRVDLTKFRPSHEQGRGDRRPLRVLCVGRLIEEKNQQTLIRAIQGLDLHLTLVGDGNMRSYLYDLVKQLGLIDRVEFIHSVPNEEINQYYRQADIFALPIKYGGIAIPVIEAMASGLPVVVPRPFFEPEPELVGDVAMVVENTPRGFHEALRQLMEDSSLRYQLGKKGRTLAESISGDKMEAKERDLYLQLLKKDEGR